MSLEELSGPALRRHIETTIEALLDQLDELDGDCDIEEAGDDEPSLGWPMAGPHVYRPHGSQYAVDSGDDREHDEAEMEEGDPFGDLEPDDEGDELDTLEGDPDEDREPSLGWNAEASQAHLMGSGGAGISGEEDEPSLAAPEGILPPPSLQWDGYGWSRAKGVKRFRSGSQEHWTQGCQRDGEEEFDGREPDPDREIEHEGGDEDMFVCV